MSETLGDCCTTGTIHEGVPRGSVELVAGLPTYVVGSKGDRVVVMITDVFGYDLTNTRLLADEYAGAGYYVLCPDFFSGDALPSEVEHQMIPPESAPKRGFFKAVTETASAIAQFGPWVYRHREAVSKPIIDTFFARLKLDLPSTAKIGAVGFCWGGRYVVLLTHADSPTKVDCAIACHPSFLSLPNEIQKVTKPLSIQVGDKDAMLSVKQAETCRSVLDQKGIASQVTIYPNQVHGFACRGDLSKKEVKEGKEKCTSATIAWLDKYLTPSSQG